MRARISCEQSSSLGLGLTQFVDILKLSPKVLLMPKTRPQFTNVSLGGSLGW